MIVIPRGLARAFRAAARKCSSGRPRGPAPSVVLAGRRGRLTLSAAYPDAALACEVEVADAPPETAVVPAEVLDAAGAACPLEIETDGRRGTARWADAAAPREVTFDAPPFDPRHGPPAPPERTVRVPPEFLAALHECGRTAARGPARYALHRLQVSGKSGRVVGTDGKLALAWGRFRLPFPDDVLVPALPVFGAKELAAAGDVRVGRTDSHVIVSAGPWTVWLPIDAAGRYPDVGGLVPRAAGASALDLDDADADAVLAFLPDLPRPSDNESPVSLTLGPRPFVRAAGARVVPLPGSAASGPSVRFAVDRDHLARALGLGFRAVRVAPPGKLAAFADRDRVLLMTTLGDVAAPDDAPAEPQHEGRDARSDAVPNAPPEPEPERSVAPMKSHDTNGPPDGADPPDPLAEAEALKAALADAAVRAGRLFQALKQDRKKTRVLESAWSALRSLNLHPGGRRDR